MKSSKHISLFWKSSLNIKNVQYSRWIFDLKFFSIKVVLSLDEEICYKSRLKPLIKEKVWQSLENILMNKCYTYWKNAIGTTYGICKWKLRYEFYLSL